MKSSLAGVTGVGSNDFRVGVDHIQNGQQCLAQISFLPFLSISQSENMLFIF